MNFLESFHHFYMRSVNWFAELGERFYRAFIEKDRYVNYFQGISVTLKVSLLAVLLGIALGIIVAVVKYSFAKKKYAVYDGEHKDAGYVILAILDKICGLYITIIRGTPVLLQMLIIYNLIFTSRNANPVLIGALCFGINSGAYQAEIIRAGLMSIDKGQSEAGKSLGLGSLAIMRCIILPQAIKNILPALANEFIVLIKETSIVGYISLIDITSAAQLIGARTYDILIPLIIAALFYLVIVIVLTYLIKAMERRLAKSDRG